MAIIITSEEETTVLMSVAFIFIEVAVCNPLKAEGFRTPKQIVCFLAKPLARVLPTFPDPIIAIFMVQLLWTLAENRLHCLQVVFWGTPLTEALASWYLTITKKA